MSNTTTTLPSETFVSAEVAILWSENSYVNAEFSVEKHGENCHHPNKVNRALRRATHHVISRNGGYDKTKFQLRITTADGDTHVYEGRTDLGSDTQTYFDVIEDHIIAFTNYCLEQEVGHWYLPTEEAKYEMILWKMWAIESKKANQEARA